MKLLRTICKSFLRPHLYYGDILYDKLKKNFQNKLEKVQYKACLSIFGTIKGASRQEMYDKLGLIH